MLQQVTSPWRTEYLLSLRERSRVNKNQREQAIWVGDMVILMNDKSNRSFWQLGKIVELLPGSDGIVRAARVKLGNSDGKSTELRRSIEHLIPLEVRQESEEEQGERQLELQENATEEETFDEQLAVRPRRKAAVVCENLRKQLLKDNQL